MYLLEMDWQLVEKKQKINEFIGKKVPAMWYNNDKKVVKNMKKLIPVLAVLGSAVAFAVYKMKKEEQKNRRPAFPYTYNPDMEMSSVCFLIPSFRSLRLL